MSSLRNAIKRKTHKERPQPQSRSKFGLLERKKDYKARADDFHRKEKALLNLRRKAEERNPDEFYFAMEHTRTKGGVHLKSSTQANKYSQEQLQLMKGQDIGYLELKRQSEAKKAERLRNSLHFIGAPVRNSHTLFVDEEEAASFSPQDCFDTPAELLGRTYNRPRRSQLNEAAAISG
ncbi:small-subunit processome, partial [Coccomyxa subellipsoidea C-169]